MPHQLVVRIENIELQHEEVQVLQCRRVLSKLQAEYLTDMHTPAHDCASCLWRTHSSPSFSIFLTLIKKVGETEACSRRWAE